METRLAVAIACLFVGVPSLQAQGMVAVGPPAFAFPAGDVDGDGHDDYLVWTSNTYLVYSGSTGLPFSHLTRPRSGFSYDPVGDVNADGCDDLAYCTKIGFVGTVRDVVSGLDGSILLQWPATLGFVAAGARAGDFDGDGYGDIAVTLNGDPGTSEYLRVLSGRDGSVVFEYVVPATGWETRSAAFVGDLDGNGCDDLGLTTAYYGSDVVALTERFLGPAGVPGASGLLTWGRAVGDTNADGRDELSRANPPSVVDGVTLAPVWTFPGIASGDLLCAYAGDVDGDGYGDVSIWDGDIVYGPTIPDLRSGQTHASMPGTASPGAHFVGDIDGDGRAELVMDWPNAGLYEWVDPAVPVGSRLVKRGVSGTTSTGRRPRIKTRGHCGLGHTVYFDVRGVVPNGLTLFLVGDAADIDLTPLGASGNRAYVTLQGVFLIPTDANGVARHLETIATSPSLLGATASVQCAAWDPAANALGLVTSNAIDLTVNN